MDKLVGSIQSLSNSDNDLKNLKNLLHKDEAVFTKNLHILDDVMSVLDPATHTLGYSYVLAARSSSSKLDPSKFMNQLQKFILSANVQQAKMAAPKIAQACRRYAELSIEGNLSLRAIKILKIAIQKVRPNSETLVPIHADFLQVCLAAKNYSAALHILEEEIFEISPEITGVTPKDLLLYYYYSGMVYTGVKEYKKALSSFRQAIVTPAIVLSAIMVESYKKYILISLLVHGKIIQLPRFASSVIQRYHKTAFPIYQEFANAFSTQSTDEVHKIAEQHCDSFQKDKNFGLVKQCIQSLYRRNIQRHTQTYLTLSLQDIATSVKVPSVKEAEKHILRMIETNEIFATVNQKDGMVSFHEVPEQYDTNKILNHLDSQVQKVIDLGKKVRSADESIASSQHYLQKSTLSEKGMARGWGGGEFGGFDEDDKPGNVGGRLM